MWRCRLEFASLLLFVIIVAPLSNAYSSSQELVQETGDAQGKLWGSDENNEEWQRISMGNITLVGKLSSNDSVDVFAIEITSEDGAIVGFAIETGENMSVIIQRLNQTDWGIEDFSNISIGEIGLPQGLHAIRVERLGVFEEEIEYAIILENVGLLSDLDGEFVNLDWMFTPFYIFAGIFLILPLLIVLWWNRDQKWFQMGKGESFSEHERQTLFALRERFAGESGKLVSEEVLETSLSLLGDGTWDSVIDQFGPAEIRYLTGHLDVSVWRFSAKGDSLLVGIKTGDCDWKMGAIRIYSPKGKAVSIGGVDPDLMFENDEVFIGDISRNTTKFLRIAIVGNVGRVSMHVSGLVDGVPVAAVPTNSIDDSEE
ncbi:MAG: hypothetical protein CMB67_01410 [Euryarchaeota archaeon]|nr:hypothetical protein [Euryarchaeota archaeon]